MDINVYNDAMCTDSYLLKNSCECGECCRKSFAGLGRTVLVEPMNPVSKAPGSMLLKLRYVGPLSDFAFKFDLRRYISETSLT